MISQVSYRSINLVSTDGSIAITELASGDTDIEVAGGGGGTPSAPDTSVQFNNAGAFGGSSNFTYVTGTNTLTVGNLVSANFTSAAQGLVPASGGGTSNFLRADGTFAAPPATAPAGSNTQIQFNNAGAFGASANFTYTSGTNTLTVGNITGSALGMTIQPLAPTSLQDPGTLLLLGRDAIKANTDGGSVLLKGGAKTGFGQPGKVELKSQDGKYIVQASNAGVIIFGAYSSSFTFSEGVFNAVGAQTAPLIDSPNVFVAGLNSTSTGNASFQFLTDSQIVFEFGEPIFGSQVLAFFGVVPVTQPTTATGSATFVVNSGGSIHPTSTFDGYTLAQVVRALRNLGILA